MKDSVDSYIVSKLVMIVSRRAPKAAERGSAQACCEPRRCRALIRCPRSLVLQQPRLSKIPRPLNSSFLSSRNPPLSLRRRHHISALRLSSFLRYFPTPLSYWPVPHCKSFSTSYPQSSLLYKSCSACSW